MLQAGTPAVRQTVWRYNPRMDSAWQLPPIVDGRAGKPGRRLAEAVPAAIDIRWPRIERPACRFELFPDRSAVDELGSGTANGYAARACRAHRPVYRRCGARGRCRS